MNTLREQLLFAHGAGDVEGLAETLHVIHQISLQTPKTEKGPAPFQESPSSFSHRNAHQ